MVPLMAPARHFNRGSSVRQSGGPVEAACGVDSGGWQRCFNNQHRRRRHVRKGGASYQRVKRDATLVKRSTHCNSTEGSLRLSGEILPKTNYCGGGKGERCYDSELLNLLSFTLLFQM